MKNLQDLLEDIRKGTYKAAIFDIDGTLLDSMPIWDDLDAIYLKTQGIHLSKEEQKALNETLWDMTMEEGVTYLKATYRLEPSEEHIAAALGAVVEDFYKNEVPLKPGMGELVAALDAAGVPLALATVGDPAQEVAALTRLGIYDHFRGLFDCAALGTTKREALIYETAAASLLGEGFDPAAVLVFEDVLHALRAAGAAGFTTVAVEDAASVKDKDSIQSIAHYFIHP